MVQDMETQGDTGWSRVVQDRETQGDTGWGRVG